MNKHFIGEIIGTLKIIDIVEPKYKFECLKCHTVFTIGFNSVYHGCKACRELLIPDERLRRIYYGMYYRCYYPNNANYKYWGARGISICNEWLNDPHSFYKWAIENGYADNLSIDRIDNDGNYEPSNCRWVTKSMQSKNKFHSKKSW